MMGTWMIVVTGVFLLLLAACLVWGNVQVRGVGSKAYHMLLLGLMKLDFALARGMAYVGLSMELIFKGYHYPEKAAASLAGKRARLKECRRRMETSSEGYRRRKQYRNKILQ